MSQRLEHDWFDGLVPDNVVLGDDTWLYSSYAFVHCRSRRETAVRVGARCGLYAGTFFDLGPDGEVVVGDYCSLVGLIVASNARVVLGDHVLVAHEVVIADSPWSTPAPSEPGAGVEIADNVWIGAGAVVLGGTTIGRDAVVGAGAVVCGDVPAGALAVGAPAEIR